MQLSAGDMADVRIRPYCMMSLALKFNKKLAPKYFGTYKILDSIEEVPYQIDLPTQSRLHLVFHVSQQKKAAGAKCGHYPMKYWKPRKRRWPNDLGQMEGPT